MKKFSLVGLLVTFVLGVTQPSQAATEVCMLEVRSMEEAVAYAKREGERRSRMPTVRQVLERVGGEIGERAPEFQLARTGATADSSSRALALVRGLKVVNALAQAATLDMHILVDGVGVNRDYDDIDRDGDRNEAVYEFDSWIRVLRPGPEEREEFSSSPFTVSGKNSTDLQKLLRELDSAVRRAEEVSDVRARLVIDRQNRRSAQVRIEVRLKYRDREIYGRGVSPREREIYLLSVSSMEEAIEKAYSSGQGARLPSDVRSILEMVGGERGPRVPVIETAPTGVVADSSSRALAAKRGLRVVSAIAQASTEDFGFIVDGQGLSRDRDDIDNDRDYREATYNFNMWFAVVNPGNVERERFMSTPFKVAGGSSSLLERNLDDIRYALDKAGEVHGFRARLRVGDRTRTGRRYVAAVTIEVEVRYENREFYGGGIRDARDFGRDEDGYNRRWP